MKCWKFVTWFAWLLLHREYDCIDGEVQRFTLVHAWRVARACSQLESLENSSSS